MLPLEIEGANLEVQLSAPRWSVAIDRVAADKVVNVGQEQNPTQRLSFDIQQDGTLVSDDRGGLTIAVRVTRQPDTPDDAAWEIEGIRLEISGRTSP